MGLGLAIEGTSHVRNFIGSHEFIGVVFGADLVLPNLFVGVCLKGLLRLWLTKENVFI